MTRNPYILAHQEWIGYVQPVGLVVSIPALLQAQAVPDRSIIPQHQQLLAVISEGPDSAIVDFPAFTQDVLGWQEDDLVGRPGGKPVPTILEVALPEYNETLRPTYAVLDPEPPDSDRPWMMLIQECPLGMNFDQIASADDRTWQASPQARIERLLRETRVPIGLLVNSRQLRLVYAPRGENSGHVTFKVSEMATISGRPIFAAMHMLLNADRLFAEAKDRRLPALLATSRKFQNLVSNKLSEQVLAALYELLRGFQAADDVRHGDLLRDVLARDPNQVYGGLLTVLMRLVFLLYAEDRDLLSTDPIYVNSYSITGLFDRLRADDSHYPDTMDQRFGAWAQLLTLFRLVFDGGGHGNFYVPAREGYLFDPDRYPFLEGRARGSKRETGQKLMIPRVPDGVVFRVLQNLLILDGERLSYRTLDVEQIGSVYETMMGFNLEVAQGKSIAIKPVKSHGAPACVNLEALLTVKSAERGKWFHEQTDQKLTGQAAEGFATAQSVDDLLAVLDRKIARNATPNVAPKGAMVLQPSDERRRSGSHYTPRSLTEPIVETTLRPILQRLGEHPKPEQILELKVCDPAMGSGAFLVEACRQLGDELVRAWHHHKCLPAIPPDEDELLHARRLVAQRCLYGVDKNPMAVDLAKLSLWLATLAREHAFTFLDHNLRCGDSLVGLTCKQIVDFHWLPVSQRQFGHEHIDDRIQQAIQLRQEILTAGDDILPAAKRQKLAQADEALDTVRFFGDLVIAAFFGADKDRARLALRDEYLAQIVEYLQSSDTLCRPDKQVEGLRSGKKSIAPFHWEIEYPEVFSRNNGGFDAIVGNPPYAGHVNLATSNHPHYTAYLREYLGEISGKCDLIGYFFRRIFSLIREDGMSGLLATNTVRQGDTRASGLRVICHQGGTIFAARRCFSWPGQASVQVCSVHLVRGRWSGPCTLDGKPVERITAYLFHTGADDEPARLAESLGRTFQGVVIRGAGFLFDDSKVAATRIDVAKRLLATDTTNSQVIRPFIGGEDFLASPTCSTQRFVIDFGQKEEHEARQWPELFSIAEAKVKSARQESTARTSCGAIIEKWWQFGHRAKAMYEAISGRQKVLACPQTPPCLIWGFVPTTSVLAQTLVVTDIESLAGFAMLQSRIHEEWAIFFCSTFKDWFRYMPSDAFETFCFPPGFEHDPRLSSSGTDYYEYRAELMIQNNEGPTDTYKRFHAANDTSTGIRRLRELHDAMDRAVLDVYGWQDIKPVCGFGLDYLELEDNEQPHDLPETLWFPTDVEALAFAAKLPPMRRRLPWRYRWPDEIRDEVLDRLLALNQQRATEERVQVQAEGLAKPKKATTRGRKKVAVGGPDLFAADNKEANQPVPTFASVPVLEAAELMVAILDELKPARVQLIAAERMFILAVYQHARELYAKAGTVTGNVISQPGNPFRALWQSLLAMGYVKISPNGMVSRTGTGLTLMNRKHPHMAKEAVSLFKEGEALKRAWPVEVDNVKYIVSESVTGAGSD